jgi:hypothetical protein
VKKASERDESIDILLNRHLHGRTTASAHSACIDADAIAAWSEGRLSADEAARVEAHLATCASCQEMLAVFARTDPSAAATPLLWQRWRLQWAVPIAAAATAIAIYVSLPDRPEQSPAHEVAVATIPQRAPESPPPPSASADSAPPPQGKSDTDVQDLKSARARTGLETKTRADEADRLTARTAPEASFSDAGSAAAKAAEERAAAAPQAQNRALDSVARQEAFQRAAAPVEIVSPDPLVRWRIIPPGRLERSTNAGKTWEPVTLPETFNVVTVRAISPTAARLIADDGRQFRTEDQGKTWTPISN